jgi:hypothetical protein
MTEHWTWSDMALLGAVLALVNLLLWLAPS